jgi:ferredoxin-NADP reductase
VSLVGEVRPAQLEVRSRAAGSANRTLRVDDKQLMSEDVCGIRLVDVEGRRLPDWTPGSHIDIALPDGRTRQYSLCGDRWDPYAYQIAVLREEDGRGGSVFIHDELRVGDTVTLGGPRNNFPLVPAERYLFVAGGIGITALLPMVEHAVKLGADWTLHYAGRSRSRMAYLERLERWGDRVQVYSDDERTRIDLTALLRAQPPGTKIYCCGPSRMLDEVAHAGAGGDVGRLRIERFVQRAARPPARTSPFRVAMAATGVEVTVEPGTSVLDAVNAAGAGILASCRMGVCGTCETRVLGGQPDHRDSLLPEDDPTTSDRMYPCVSGSLGDLLVLDA